MTLPVLAPDRIADTRDSVHAHAQVLGDWLASCRARRKHWWQLSLRPSLRGLSTGMVHADVDFEFELDLVASRVRGLAVGADPFDQAINGSSGLGFVEDVAAYLVGSGVSRAFVPAASERDVRDFPGYSREVAADLASAWRFISAAFVAFQAGIPEETSPIQLWPHHFDLAMMWAAGTEDSRAGPGG